MHETAYRFIALPQERLCDLKKLFQDNTRDLFGTITLSPEGINLAISGNDVSISAFKCFIEDIPEFRHLNFKQTVSYRAMFRKMLVKIKSRLIPLPYSESVAPYLEPEMLHHWYIQNRNFIVLDVRNDYEIALGKFKNTYSFKIKHFKELPQHLANLPEQVTSQAIVSVCTGGIRCEKASSILLNQGIDVYQLKGGILEYFSRCGGDFFEGLCFVFDERIAVKPDLTSLSD